MKRLLFLMAVTGSLVLVLGYSAAHAARSSKPKEIVVVGSKIKEVVKEAGLRSDGELVQALSEQVIGAVRDAMHRAAWNHRESLRFHDLTCWPELDAARVTSANDNQLIIPGLLRIRIRERGFFADREMMEAINAKTWLILEDAIQRATANGRKTVRPHDL